MTEDERKRLGDLMRERRVALRLTIGAAAQAAGLDRMTWSNAEKGTRALRDFAWPAVEAALGWSSGSIQRILDGGEPGRVIQGTASATLGPLIAQAIGETARPPVPTGHPYDLADEVDRISRLHHLSVEQRMRMIRALVEMHEREEAAQAQAQAASK